jgi:hypothetical protein
MSDDKGFQRFLDNVDWENAETEEEIRGNVTDAVTKTAVR